MYCLVLLVFSVCVMLLISEDVILCVLLSDVLALVKNIGKLEEYRIDDQTRKKLRMIFCDTE